MTANDVYEDACALMDEIGDSGTVNTDTDYAGKAPKLINMLQREVAKYDGTILTSNNRITSLDSNIAVSEDAADAMVYGLAAKLALADRNADAYNEYSAKYEQMKRNLMHDEEEIEDVYDVLGGMQ